MRFKASSVIARPGVLGAAVALFLLTVMGGARVARADLVAAYLQGHGGISSVQVDGVTGQRPGSATALGFQAGVRLLGLEVYGDHTSFGSGAAVQRGILGLRLGFGLRDTRLELRAGGGLIGEYGGALVGPVAAANRIGVVGRVGVDLEKRLSEALLLGFGVTAETFTLDNSDNVAGIGMGGGALQRDGWIRGSDIFASLHLKFELGI